MTSMLAIRLPGALRTVSLQFGLAAKRWQRTDNREKLPRNLALGVTPERLRISRSGLSVPVEIKQAEGWATPSRLILYIGVLFREGSPGPSK